MKKESYWTMSTPDMEERLSELQSELALAVDDEEREELLQDEIDTVTEMLQERYEREAEIDEAIAAEQE